MYPVDLLGQYYPPVAPFICSSEGKINCNNVPKFSHRLRFSLDDRGHSLPTADTSIGQTVMSVLDF
jgi:hypothetical protein